jgi:hypothetical protein
MAALSKTAGVVVLAHQPVTHPATVVGTAQDVSTKFAATILLFHSSIEATANTNPGKFLVQVSGSATGNEDWATVYEFDATISTADTQAMTATEPVGEKVLAVTDTTGFAAYDNLYVQHSTLANSEWGTCQEIVTSTSIDLVDGLTNEQTSSSVIWNDADIWTVQLDLTAVTRIRVNFQCEGAVGCNCHIKALGITSDSIA